MRRRRSRSSSCPRAAASPWATRGRSASFMRTSTPACTIVVPAIPDPMNPAPTIASRCTAAGGGASGMPKSFLSWVVAKKIWTSLRETSVAAAHPRKGAELDLGQAELRLGVVRGDAVVAGERELESSAETGAVDADGDRLREARDAVHHLLPLGREPLGLGGAPDRHELLDVRARDEVLGFAREHGDRPHRGVVLERREGRDELILHRAGELVDGGVLQVERDDGDAVGGLPGERRSRHQRRSSTMADAIPPCAHTEMSPNCTSRRFISFASVVTSRPPVAPNGCPIEIELPITLMMSSLISQPRSSKPFRLESTCAANASWISISPRSFHATPARSSARGTVNTGACSSCHPGSTAPTA